MILCSPGPSVGSLSVVLGLFFLICSPESYYVLNLRSCVLLFMAVCRIYLSPGIILFTNGHLLFDYSCVLNYACQIS